MSAKKSLYMISMSILIVYLPFLNTIILQASLFRLDFEQTQIFFQKNPDIYYFSTFILLVLSLWVISIVGNIFISEILMLVFTISIAFTNYQKLLSRNAPLYPEEMSMITDINGLKNLVDGKQIAMIIFLFVGLIAFSLLSRFLIKNKLKITWNKKFTFPIRIILFITTSVLLFNISNLNDKDSKTYKYLQDKGLTFVDWNQNENYVNNGFTIAFTYNIMAEKMIKPDNYNKAEIEKIVTKYQNISKKHNSSSNIDMSDVNVIYIMNESFTNPNTTLDLYPISSNPIPTISTLLENYPSGQVLVPEYGGGTANVEFEALTGLSNYFLTGVPYQNVLPQIKNMPNIVSYFNSLDYLSTAFHPYYGNMYKRNTNYTNLGFNKFYDVDTLTHTEWKEPAPYVSDEEAYLNVLDQLNATEKNQFLLMITMQNHMPYDAEYPYNEFTVSDENLSSEQIGKMQTYLQNLHHSDLAIEEFITALDQIDKKTVVVFWGDHYPGDGIYDHLFNSDERRVHSTPLFFYSNFEIENADLGTISPNFISNNLIDIIDYPVTPFYSLLNSLEEEYNAITKNTILDNKDEILKNKNEITKNTVFNDYHLIQYDILNGKKFSQDLNFFKISN